MVDALTSSKFWLYDWIDTFEVKKVEQAASLLNDKGLLKDLRKRAGKVIFTTEAIPTSDAPTLVAGRAIDLSGELDCYAWECMKAQVDKLFKHAWHYFDRIVVVGPSAHAFSQSSESDDESEVIEWLLTYVRLLLYIREIGAEDLLIFREKRPPCEEHLEQHLTEVGLDPTLALTEELIESLTRRAEIAVDADKEHCQCDFKHYVFTHPEFEHTVWGLVERSAACSEEVFKREVSASVIRRYLANLASDVYTAQVLHSPLGSTVHFHGQLLNTFKSVVRHEDVAFRLQLPVLTGISPYELLKIRLNEKEHFEKFRQSLRLAIQERVKNASDEKAESIADEIRRDIINPALADIEVRLKAAKEVVAKKAGLGITLGALATTCGLLIANPILTAAGVTAVMGGSLTAGQKFIEERRDIELSDMYFLWQAQQHGGHHKST